MSGRLRVKGWSDFQHYKDRSPPWIKLHRGLLDNYEYQMLPVASRALAPMIWLLASESVDGSIDGDPDKLAFRLRTTRKEIEQGLKPLIGAGFLVPEDPAINPLAPRSQLSIPETEGEGETEEEEEEEGDTEEETAAADDPVFISFTLAAKGRHDVRRSKVDYYRGLFPAADVEQELRKMVGWCDAKPDRKKTKRGIEAFIVRWLSKAQDSGGSRSPASATPRGAAGGRLPIHPSFFTDGTSGEVIDV
jgi:hypothetical protein